MICPLLLSGTTSCLEKECAIWSKHRTECGLKNRSDELPTLTTIRLGDKHVSWINTGQNCKTVDELEEHLIKPALYALRRMEKEK